MSTGNQLSLRAKATPESIADKIAILMTLSDNIVLKELLKQTKVADFAQLQALFGNKRLFTSLYKALIEPFPTLTVHSKPESKHTHSPADKEDYEAETVIAQLHSWTVDETQAILAMLFELPLGVVSFFPFSVLRTEADVNECMKSCLLEPCLRAIQGLLQAWYSKEERSRSCPIIELYSQEYRNGKDNKNSPYGGSTKMFVDHAFVVKRGDRRHYRKKNRSRTKEYRYLLLIEEKAPEAITFSELMAFASTKGRPINTISGNMKSHLTQLLKYVNRFPCKYTVLADACTFIGMEWMTVEEANRDKVIFWDMNQDVRGKKPELLLGGQRTAYTSILYLLVRSLMDKGYFA